MEYQFERFELPRTWPARVVRQLLVERAERAGWELARMRVYPNGRRVVTMRRKVIRVVKTSPVLDLS